MDREHIVRLTRTSQPSFASLCHFVNHPWSALVQQVGVKNGAKQRLLEAPRVAIREQRSTWHRSVGHSILGHAAPKSRVGVCAPAGGGALMTLYTCAAQVSDTDFDASACPRCAFARQCPDSAVHHN